MPGQPAPDGRRLRGDRQRRPRAAAAARPADRELRRPGRAGPRGAGRAQAERSPTENRQAILDGLRGAASAPGGTSTPVFATFPVDIAGKTGTAEKGARPRRPVLVRRAGAVARPEVRGGRDRRGGRLRRRHRGADGAPHPGRALQRRRAAAGPGRRALRLMVHHGRPGLPRHRPAPAAARPAAAARDARPGRGQRLHGPPGDARRHPRRPQLLHGPPADLHRRRAGADAGAVALRLLATARVEARRLRLR